MNANQIVEKIKNGKNLTDNEWFEIRDEIEKFLANNPPEEERKLFVPFGLMEVVSMVCDGIENKT